MVSRIYHGSFRAIRWRRTFTTADLKRLEGIKFLPSRIWGNLTVSRIYQRAFRGPRCYRTTTTADLGRLGGIEHLLPLIQWY